MHRQRYPSPPTQITTQGCAAISFAQLRYSPTRHYSHQLFHTTPTNHTVKPITHEAALGLRVSFDGQQCLDRARVVVETCAHQCRVAVLRP